MTRCIVHCLSSRDTQNKTNRTKFQVTYYPEITSSRLKRSSKSTGKENKLIVYQRRKGLRSEAEDRRQMNFSLLDPKINQKP
ncbi:hypothetical protein J6590_023856 [Homalodisca vitripennis]|nr:hypothetical protein J6590_023856 [Homalodisca vitripennis]